MNIFCKYDDQGRTVDAGVRMSAHAFAEQDTVGEILRVCLIKQTYVEVMRWYGGGVRLLKVKAKHIQISHSHLC